jgi:ribosomal protein S18 acetylase RimI-like enzyme
MSIAVDEGVRGNGVGRDLINVLHEMFVKEYGIGSVSLYCRVIFNYIFV